MLSSGLFNTGIICPMAGSIWLMWLTSKKKYKAERINNAFPFATILFMVNLTLGTRSLQKYLRVDGFQQGAFAKFLLVILHKGDEQLSKPKYYPNLTFYYIEYQ